MALRDQDAQRRLSTERALDRQASDVSSRAEDAVLVRAFQAGDPLAFPAIYERYRPLARHIAFRILRSPEEADETSQETMLRVYQGLNRFEGELRLQGWVARISANLALDTVRQRSRRPARADRPVEEVAAHLPDPAQDPEALVARMLEDEEVRRVLATLPPHYRDALVMREYWGRSHAEIGAALGVTPPQAKALLHRAKGSFRKAWEAASSGVAGIAPLLLLPFKKVFGLGAETASAAVHATQAAPTLTLVPQLAQTAASSSGMAERIAAAGMAVLVVAGVGAGAVVVQDRVVAPKPAAVVAAAPVADGATTDDATGSGEGTQGQDAGAAAATSDTSTDAATDGATTDAAAAPADGTATDPTATDGAAPVLGDPPAPVISITSPIVLCDGCTVTWSVVSATHAGSLADGDLRFTDRLLGTVTDASGAAVEAWSMTSQISGSIVGGDGTARISLALTTPDGDSTWTGKGLLSPKSGSSFALAGTWVLESAAPGATGLPAGGTLAGTLGLWSDGASPTSLTLALRAL
ncbi:MAG: sigma-70 family RNA polymerase sigma factor [Actinomycetota bacterium]